MKHNAQTRRTHLGTRILSLFLTTCLLCSMLPVSADAEEAPNIIQSRCTHQYLSDVDIQVKKTEASYPGFKFNPMQSEYFDLKFQMYTTISLIPKLAENYLGQPLYARVIYSNGSIYSKHKDVQVDGTKSIDLNSKFFKEKGHVFESDHTIFLVVGPTQYSAFSGPQETDDVYAFHFSVYPGIADTIPPFINSDEQAISYDDPSGEFDTAMAFLSSLGGTICTYRHTTAEDKVSAYPLYQSNGDESLYYHIGSDAGSGEWIKWDGENNITILFDESDSETIPVQLKVVGGEKESIFYFEFTRTVAVQITAHPEGFECEKNTLQTLSVAAVSSGPSAEITYQWQRTRREDLEMFSDITGETSNTFTPPTDKAGTWYYRCVVSAFIDGKSYSIPSEAAKCTVLLNRVNTPKIIRPLGSFVPKSKEEYKTEYREGQPFDPMYIGLSELEAGTEYAFEVLRGTTDSIENAEIYGAAVKIDRSASGTHEGKYYAAYYIEDSGQLPVGEHYIFLRATAVDETNLDNRSEPVVSSIKLTYKPNEFNWTKGGTGTAGDPYKITEASDLEYIRMVVNEWNDRLTGKCFRFENDITLSDGWTPIGGGSSDGLAGLRVFSGQIDGNHFKLTIPTGGKPLFNLVSAAVIKNLNIYGEQVDGCALINSYFVDYGLDGRYETGCPETVTLENVRLLTGSSTRQSGFMLGSGSGANTITLRNCTVDPGVTIGYDGTESGIGSFVGGAFNGQMEGCYSAATVRGTRYVGGLAGSKGQSMGLCSFTNCGFTGTIEAAGEWVGGIIGGGYVSESAPNTMVVSFNNCFVNATISAANNVGGIFGGEGGVRDTWNRCILSNSTFYGTINSTGENIGGIIGCYNGVNTLQEMENNHFCELTEGRTLGAIGRVNSYSVNSGRYSFASQAAADEWYANTGKAIVKENYNAQEVAGLLNSGSTSLKNWVVGTDGFPAHSTAPVLIRLQINGTWLDQQLGQPLNTAGITYTGIWTGGRTEDIPAASVTIIGYDQNKHGSQTLTAAYQGVRQEFTVTVKRPEGKINVSFTMKGDTPHGTPASADPAKPDGTHTLAKGGLTDWVVMPEAEVSSNATVLDVIEQALRAQTDHKYEVTNETGNYISAIARDGTVLKETTNGPKSGWMYTLNGKYSDLGVSEQFLNDDDSIVFYYTDDYTVEKNASEKPGDDNPGTTVTEYKPYLTGVLSWLNTNVPSPKVSTTNGEWAVLAQARGGVLAGAARQAYLTNLWQHADERGGVLDESGFKHTEYSRVVLALTSVGVDASAVKNGAKTYDFVQPLLQNNCAQAIEQGNNGTIFALTALDSGGYLSNDDGKKARATLIDELCRRQKTDGSWSIDPSDPEPDIDTTAMAVQALARYYSMMDSEYRQIGTQTAQSVLKGKVDLALTYLKSRQNSTTGGFGSPEADAQVIVALSALKQDAGQYKKGGSRSVLSDLLSYAVGTAGAGTPVSFSKTRGGQANQMSTEQAAYALVAYDRFSSSKSKLYDMTDVILSGADLNIKLTQYTITVNAGAGGIISPGVETVTVAKGDSKTFIITPSAGYQIRDVKVDGVSIGAQSTYTFTNITGGHTISAEFEKATGNHTITVSSGAGGTISPGTTTVAAGGSRTFTITPFTGYKTVDVKVDGYSLGAQATYTFTNITSNHTITASFASATGGITVYFTLKGDSSHGSGSYAHTLSSGGLQTWIPRQAVTVSKGAKVYDVFTQVLNQHGYRYIGADQNYVETIITPSGLRLSEFTNGRNSGWMYTVNGTHPEQGLQYWTVYDGDEIIWHYTDDYTQERGGASGPPTNSTGAAQLSPAVSGTNAFVSSSDFSSAVTAAINTNSGTILVAPVGSAGASTLTVNLPAGTLYTAADSGIGVTVQSGAGTIVIPSTTLASLANTARGSQLSVTAAGKSAQQGVNLLSGRSDVTAAQLANSSVTEVTMTSGGQSITNWGGHPITLSLPVNGTGFSAGNRYTVYQVSSSGIVETHSGYCSRQNSSLYVEVSATHLSTFIVVPNQGGVSGTYLPFLDVNTSDWFYGDVAYAYSSGLFNGDSPTAFAPYGRMNRAMLVTVLHRSEGTPAAARSSGFTDVASGQWFTNGVAWASGIGVVNGKGNGKFDPYGSITREEIATILYRYAKVKGWDVTASANLYSFNDGSRTSDWAARAMQWACAKGIINGKGGGKLDPGGFATRAEVAAMIRRFIEAY